MSRAAGVLAVGELRRQFRRPLTFAVLALITGFMAVVFMLLLIQYLGQDAPQGTGGVTQRILVPYFHLAVLVNLLLIPIVTMAVIAGEARDGRLRYLFSAPVSSLDIVTAKLTGTLGLAAAAWATVSLIPLTLLWGAPIDLGVYVTNLLGLGCFVTMHVCLGVLASAMTSQPVLAGAGALLGSLALWFADWANRLDPQSSAVGSLSTFSRLRGFALGVVNAADLVYFAVAALLCVALSVWRIEGQRRYG